MRQSTSKPLDSGKLSDSSHSSAHGYRRLQETAAIGDDSSCVDTQSIPDPHVHNSSSQFTGSISKSTDIRHSTIDGASVIPSDAMSACHRSTPQPKKKNQLKLIANDSVGSSPTDTVVLQNQHVYVGSMNRDPSMLSLTRSGSFMSTSRESPVGSSRQTLSIHAKEEVPDHMATSSVRRILDNAGGATGFGSDDSMHEKYFKSVESTPISKRRSHLSGSANILSGNSADISQESKHCLDTSPHSPAGAHQTNSASRSGLEIQPSTLKMSMPVSSQKGRNDVAGMMSEKNSSAVKIGDSSNVGGSGISMTQINSLLKAGHRNRSTCVATNVEKHSKDLEPNEGSYKRTLASTSTNSRMRSRNQPHAYGISLSGARPTDLTGVGGDNGNISPLYSNWDQEMQEHLLPLQHYIIEQAKLSGCYKLGIHGAGISGASSGDAIGLDSETMDSDSLHSDSASEHSFSGHEPDNEDSDHSDGRDNGYLAHHYGGIGDYGYGGTVACDHHNDEDGDEDDDDEDDDDEGGVSYYNMDKRYLKNDQKDM